jgi:hypothetical protein
MLVGRKRNCPAPAFVPCDTALASWKQQRVHGCVTWPLVLKTRRDFGVDELFRFHPLRVCNLPREVASTADRDYRSGADALRWFPRALRPMLLLVGVSLMFCRFRGSQHFCDKAHHTHNSSLVTVLLSSSRQRSAEERLGQLEIGVGHG